MSNQQNSNMNEEQDSSNKKFNYEDCYRIAIEERARHQQNYNHWMNMYAIFNGALLVAFTAFSKPCNEFFLILITLLGIITSALWCFSVNGYYEWIISWINVVSFYESKLKIEENKPVYIYRLFSKTKTKFPFSTQKCTQFFTKCVCGAWVFLFSYQVLQSFSTIKDWVQQYRWIIGTVLLFFVLILLVIGFFSKLIRENLTETHKNLTIIRTSNSRSLNSELQDICDFEE